MSKRDLFLRLWNPARSKMSREHLREVTQRTEGLEQRNPSAPGIGLNGTPVLDNYKDARKRNKREEN